MSVKVILVEYRVVVGERLGQPRQARRRYLLERRLVRLVADAADADRHAILGVVHCRRRLVRISLTKHLLHEHTRSNTLSIVYTRTNKRLTKQVAAVLTARGRITSATEQITSAHTRYFIYFKGPHNESSCQFVSRHLTLSARHRRQSCQPCIVTPLNWKWPASDRGKARKWVRQSVSQ